MLFIIVLFIVNILIKKVKYVFYLFVEIIDYWIIDKDYSWKLFFLIFVKKE